MDNEPCISTSVSFAGGIDLQSETMQCSPMFGGNCLFPLISMWNINWTFSHVLTHSSRCYIKARPMYALFGRILYLDLNIYIYVYLYALMYVIGYMYLAYMYVPTCVCTHIRTCVCRYVGM